MMLPKWIHESYKNGKQYLIGKGLYHGTFMGAEPNSDNYKGGLY